MEFEGPHTQLVDQETKPTPPLGVIGFRSRGREIWIRYESLSSSRASDVPDSAVTCSSKCQLAINSYAIACANGWLVRSGSRASKKPHRVDAEEFVKPQQHSSRHLTLAAFVVCISSWGKPQLLSELDLRHINPHTNE